MKPGLWAIALLLWTGVTPVWAGVLPVTVDIPPTIEWPEQAREKRDFQADFRAEAYLQAGNAPLRLAGQQKGDLARSFAHSIHLAAAPQDEDIRYGSQRFSRVPEPGSFALFGLGLLGLAFARRQFQD